MSWVFVECCVFVLAVLLCWCLPSTRYCLLRQKFFLWPLLSSVSVIVLLCWSLRSCLFAVVSHCDSFCFVLVMSSLSWVVNNRFSLKVLVSASRAPSALAGLCLPACVVPQGQCVMCVVYAACACVYACRGGRPSHGHFISGFNASVVWVAKIFWLRRTLRSCLAAACWRAESLCRTAHVVPLRCQLCALCCVSLMINVFVTLSTSLYAGVDGRSGGVSRGLQAAQEGRGECLKAVFLF